MCEDMSGLRADGYGCSVDVKMLTQTPRTREYDGLVGKRALRAGAPSATCIRLVIWWPWRA
jgi:hypothetical protein